MQAYDETVERQKYWNEVKADLLSEHGLDEADADARIGRLIRQFEERETLGSLPYHRAPAEVAFDLAGKARPHLA